MKDANPQSSIGIVLLNMGGPDSLDAVEPFLYNLFADRDLIQLPLGAFLQKPFARLISRRRAKSVVDNYRAIGGKSPLLHWTKAQAKEIAQALGEGFKPYVAMRYWHPTAEEALRQMAEDGVERAVVLSMYPHYTGATTGSSVKDFRHCATLVHPDLKYRIIEQWYDWPGYLDALAARVEEGLEKFPDELQPRVQILFSAHALPQKFIDRGDPYLEHVLDTARGVMARIGNRAWRLGFQSRSGPVKWMEPDTVDVLDQLAEDNRNAVLMVPISFVSDHIETLHEIDIEYREHAHKKGIEYFERIPSLNAHSDFIEALASLVRKEMENWR